MRATHASFELQMSLLFVRNAAILVFLSSGKTSRPSSCWCHDSSGLFIDGCSTLCHGVGLDRRCESNFGRWIELNLLLCGARLGNTEDDDDR